MQCIQESEFFLVDCNLHVSKEICKIGSIHKIVIEECVDIDVFQGGTNDVDSSEGEIPEDGIADKILDQS